MVSTPGISQLAFRLKFWTALKFGQLDFGIFLSKYTPKEEISTQSHNSDHPKIRPEIQAQEAVGGSTETCKARIRYNWPNSEMGYFEENPSEKKVISDRTVSDNARHEGHVAKLAAQGCGRIALASKCKDRIQEGRRNA